MSKNIFIAILSLTTLYLGWVAFTHGSLNSKAFAAKSQAFTTNNQNTGLQIQYNANNCAWVSSKDGSNKTDTNPLDVLAKDGTTAGTIMVSQTPNSSSKPDVVCPQGQVAIGVDFENENTSWDGNSKGYNDLGIRLWCCSVNVVGLYN